MNKVLSIYIGNQAQNISSFFYHLEAQQIFDEEDPLDHQVIWKDVNKRIPRMLIYDFKNSIKALEHINNSTNKKIINKLESNPLQVDFNSYDLQGQIKKSLQKIKPNIQNQQNNIWHQVFSNFTPLKKSCIQINKYQIDSEWNTFYAGEALISSAEKIETYTQPIRKELQQQDFLSGFTFWVDGYNGFGSFSQRLLEVLSQECHKKAIYYNNIGNPNLKNIKNKQLQFQKINNLINLSQISKKVNVYQQFNHTQVTFPYFQQVDQYSVFRAIAPLVSNLHVPFSYKNSNNFTAYVQNMTPLHQNNIFNTAYTLPFIEQQKLKQQHSVFNYCRKFNQLNYLRDFTRQTQKSLIFSESYVLRGSVQIQLKEESQASARDLKSLQFIISQKQNQVKFIEKYKSFYGDNQTSYPFHSVLFNHENFKHQIKSIYTQFQKVGKSVFEAYYKIGKERDDFKQMKQNILSLYDNYDKSHKKQEQEDD